MVQQTQLFIDLETVKFGVNLSDVEVVGENVAVANLVNFAHHFCSIVA